MKTATVKIPDDLRAELDQFARHEQVSVDEVVESALKRYLAERRDWGGREVRPATRPFHITPLVERDDHGEPDVSVNHDKYLAKP